jgi:hypothetical protein
MGELKQYNMTNTMAISDIGIQVSMRYLLDVLKYPEVLYVDGKAVQSKDIDLIAVKEDDFGIVGATIEVKTDRYTTGNLFFETISNIQKGTPGCLMYSEADFLHYYFVGYAMLYVMHMKMFREWVTANQHRFKTRQTSTGNEFGMFYTSEGILIPLRDIRNNFLSFKGKCIDAKKHMLL